MKEGGRRKPTNRLGKFSKKKAIATGTIFKPKELQLFGKDVLQSFEMQPANKQKSDKRHSKNDGANTSMQLRKKVIFKDNKSARKMKIVENDKNRKGPNRSEITVQDARMKQPSNLSHSYDRDA